MKGPKDGVMVVNVKLDPIGKNVLLVSIRNLEELANLIIKLINQKSKDNDSDVLLELLTKEKKEMFAAIKQDLVKKHKSGAGIAQLEINVTDTLQVENIKAMPSSKLIALAEMYDPDFNSYKSELDLTKLNTDVTFLQKLMREIGIKLEKEIMDIFNQDHPTPLTMLTITKWNKHQNHPDYQPLKKLISAVYSADGLHSENLNNWHFKNQTVAEIITAAFEANKNNTNNNHKSFRRSFDVTIDDFLERQQKVYEENGDIELFESMRELKWQQSLNFLICEAAGHILDAAAGTERVIYFGKRIPALDATYTTFIEPYNIQNKFDLCKWISPHFERRRPNKNPNDNPVQNAGNTNGLENGESKTFNPLNNVPLSDIKDSSHLHAMIFQLYAKQMEEQWQTLATIISHQNEALTNFAMTLMYPHPPETPRGFLSVLNTDVSDTKAQTFKDLYNKQNEEFQKVVKKLTSSSLQFQKAPSHAPQSLFAPKPTPDNGSTLAENSRQSIHKVASAPTSLSSLSGKPDSDMKAEGNAEHSVTAPIDINNNAAKVSTTPQASPPGAPQLRA